MILFLIILIMPFSTEQQVPTRPVDRIISQTDVRLPTYIHYGYKLESGTRTDVYDYTWDQGLPDEVRTATGYYTHPTPEGHVVRVWWTATKNGYSPRVSILSAERYANRPMDMAFPLGGAGSAPVRPFGYELESGTRTEVNDYTWYQGLPDEVRIAMGYYTHPTPEGHVVRVWWTATKNGYSPRVSILSAERYANRPMYQLGMGGSSAPVRPFG